MPGRARGLHLADKGREQANAVAERIAPFKGKVDAVYASPLERTRETAAPIAKQLGLRVRTSKGLLECDFGEWTGAELKTLMKLPEWKQVQRYPSGFRFPGGESFVDMQTRIVDEVDAPRRQPPGQGRRRGVARRSDQGRSRARASAPISTCSNASSSRRAR